MNMMNYINAFLMSFVLVSCAAFQAMRSPSQDYRAFVEGRLSTEKVYDAGRLMLAAQILPIDESLRSEQMKVSPTQVVSVDQEKKQFIIAVNSFYLSSLRNDQIQFFLSRSGEELLPVHVVEITDASVIETLYSFASHHYRVFQVSFSGDIANPVVGYDQLKVAVPGSALQVKTKEI